MYCPYCKVIPVVVGKHAYHHLDRASLQPYNTFLTTLYECPVCGTTIETTQQVRITNKKEG